MFRRSYISAFTALTLILSTSASLAQSAFLSGGATMQIDIEVYKGPLAKDIRSQLAEFHGLLEQTKLQFIRLYSQIELWQKTVGSNCGTNTEKKNDTVEKYICDIAKRLRTEACLLLNDAENLPRDFDVALHQLDKYREFQAGQKVERSTNNSTTANTRDAPPIRETCINFANAELSAGVRAMVVSRLSAVAPGAAREQEKEATPKDLDVAAEIRKVAVRATSFSKQISRSAQNWQEIQTAVFLPDQTLRALLTSYQFAAAEQANQISSRADALLQQIDGLDRRELPLSAFLAGTAPTGFARLFEWNNADLYPLLSGQKVEDRVKILERLQADMQWARVNTVFASGRGDVSMAFIKDDIGNWSLKQFDNAPGELLQAYTGVAKAALVQASNLATSFATGGSTAGIKQLVGLADSIAFGSNAPPDQSRPGLDLQPAHERLQARLTTIHEFATTQEAKPGIDKAALRKSVEADIRNALEAYKATLDLLDEVTPSSGGSGNGPLPTAPLDALKGQLPAVPVR